MCARNRYLNTLTTWVFCRMPFVLSLSNPNQLGNTYESPTLLIPQMQRTCTLFCFRQVSISCNFDNSWCVYLFLFFYVFTIHITCQKLYRAYIHCVVQSSWLVSCTRFFLRHPNITNYVHIVLTVGYTSLALVTGTFLAQRGKLFSREDARNKITWHFEILMTVTM
jgi:hypothetical protein